MTPMTSGHNQAHDDLLRTKTRRHFLKESGAGIGGIALASLLAESVGVRAADITPADPLAPRG